MSLWIFTHDSEHTTLIQTAPLKWDDPNSFQLEDYCPFLLIPASRSQSGSHLLLTWGRVIGNSSSIKWGRERKANAWAKHTLVTIIRRSDNVTEIYKQGGNLFIFAFYFYFYFSPFFFFSSNSDDLSGFILLSLHSFMLKNNTVQQIWMKA